MNPNFSDSTKDSDHTGIRKPARRTMLVAVVRWFTALVAIAVVVEPIVWRGRLSVNPPVPSLIQSLRYTPNTTRLQEIAQINLQDIPVPLGYDALLMADRLLAGQDFMHGFSGAPYALPFTPKARASDLMLQRDRIGNRRPPVVYTLPFAEADLLRSDGIGRLPYASLYFADVMLNAYSHSKEARYLMAARDIIVGFSRYERSRWRGIGFLWNDHAIAARAGVLVRFWTAYRTHSIYDASDAVDVLTQAAHTVELLASGRDFNVRTNHGVMQNVALLQLLLSMPPLDQGREYLSRALRRLEAQVAFLYSPDGFVLEHSAHYHEVGVRLLGMAIRLLEFADEPVPDAWRTQHSAAKKVLDLITRPDGTLPAFGDTELELWPQPVLAPPQQRQSTVFDLYPLSGYAVWSFGGERPSHTLVSWSLFPGHGHKLADELSLIIWGQGRGWVTNGGYWDYSGWGRRHMEGWQGSNAPHLLGEGVEQPRHARVVIYGYNDDAAFLELERKSADDTRFTREIVSLSAGLWLVVDEARSPVGSQVETLWTFFPDMSIEMTGSDSYLVRDGSSTQMFVGLWAEQALQTELYRGNQSPFAGWVTMGREGLPAPALRVVAASGSRTATLFSLHRNHLEGFVMTDLGENRWQASGSGWRARREGDLLEVKFFDITETLPLHTPPHVGPQREMLRTRFEKALEAYPREPSLDAYRDRVAAAMVMVLIAQEAAFALLRRRRSLCMQVSVAVLFMWVAGSLWLNLHYFQVS